MRGVWNPLSCIQVQFPPAPVSRDITAFVSHCQHKADNTVTLNCPFEHNHRYSMIKHPFINNNSTRIHEKKSILEPALANMYVHQFCWQVGHSDISVQLEW